MSALCPSGHLSEDSDYCDTCGAKIGAPTPASTPAPTSLLDLGADTLPCPNCQSPMPAADRFCESCGFDKESGHAPAPVPAPLAAPLAAPAPASTPAPAPTWTASVAADRVWYQTMNAGVPFPPAYPTRTFTLLGDQVQIGRKSASKGLNPEMDLTGPPQDPGISHLHAILTRNPEGRWLISDPGSTNGTVVNEGAPLTPDQLVELKDGDQVHIGAWTTITLHEG